MLKIYICQLLLSADEPPASPLPSFQGFIDAAFYTQLALYPLLTPVHTSEGQLAPTEWISLHRGKTKPTSMKGVQSDGGSEVAIPECTLHKQCLSLCIYTSLRCMCVCMDWGGRFFLNRICIQASEGSSSHVVYAVSDGRFAVVILSCHHLVNKSHGNIKSGRVC